MLQEFYTILPGCSFSRTLLRIVLVQLQDAKPWSSLMLCDLFRRALMFPISPQVPQKDLWRSFQALTQTEAGFPSSSSQLGERRGDFPMQEFIGMGRDARALWEEVASLAAELGATASGRWGMNLCPHHVHTCVALTADQRGLLMLLRAGRGAKPEKETPAHPSQLRSVPSCMESVVALQQIWWCCVFMLISQILLLSVLGLILGGLKESTLGRIIWGEDT